MSGNGGLLAPETNSTGWAQANGTSISHLRGWEEETAKGLMDGIKEELKDLKGDLSPSAKVFGLSLKMLGEMNFFFFFGRQPCIVRGAVIFLEITVLIPYGSHSWNVAMQSHVAAV